MHLKSLCNEPCVDGISITLGSPRQHMWTYAATGSDGLNFGVCNCPCAPVPGASPPMFVKDNYYSESGAPQGPWIYISDLVLCNMANFVYFLSRLLLSSFISCFTTFYSLKPYFIFKFIIFNILVITYTWIGD